MRLTPTSIAAILSLCAISNLALGQSVEPQLEAPEPDITTFDAGENYTTTFDTKNDIDMLIRVGAALVNGVGYTMYNNVGASLENAGAQLTNNGTLTNSGSLWNKRYLPPVVGATTELIPTLTNNGTLNNLGELYNYGTLKNNGNIYNAGTINDENTIINNGRLYNDGTITTDIDTKAGSILNGEGTINGTVTVEGEIGAGSWVGTMTTGDQIWLDGGKYVWQINNSDGSQGGTTGWDVIDTSAITVRPYDDGILDLSQLTTGGFGINIISLDTLNAIGAAEGFDDPNAEYEFVIVTTVDGIIGFDAEDFVINGDDFQNTGTWDWSIEQDGNNLVLSATGYTLVPEPSSLALLGMGGLGLLLRRKRS